jgi:hypothetical protein
MATVEDFHAYNKKVMEYNQHKRESQQSDLKEALQLRLDYIQGEISLYESKAKDDWDNGAYFMLTEEFNFLSKLLAS